VVLRHPGGWDGKRVRPAVDKLSLVCGTRGMAHRGRWVAAPVPLARAASAHRSARLRLCRFPNSTSEELV
jgi:hypothetical protein